MTGSDPLAATVTVSADALFQELEGEAVLLDLRSECYFGLDETGTRIWQLIEQHGLLQTVYQQMLNEYEVDGDTDADVLRQDLLDFVDRLLDAGLVSYG